MQKDLEDMDEPSDERTDPPFIITTITIISGENEPHQSPAPALDLNCCRYNISRKRGFLSMALSPRYGKR
jgi:hypothetical protein